MIYGIGCDIVEPARIKRAYQRKGEAFVDTLLSQWEKPIFIDRYMKNETRGILYLSTRWAAKEAFAKAYGLGVREEINLQQVSVLNNEYEMPYLHFDPPLSNIMQEEQLTTHLTLSDTHTAVIAFVICERYEHGKSR